MQRLARSKDVPFFTHDNRILDIADRIIHMEDGRLEEAEAKKQRDCQVS